MAAAHKDEKRIKVIKALDLRWKAFKQHAKVLATVTAKARHCNNFTLRILATTAVNRADEAVQGSAMIKNAVELQAIELNFETYIFGSVAKAVDLSRVLTHQAYWPNLRTLQSHSFTTSEIHLKGLLAVHAPFLQSLDLSPINFASYESKGRFHYSFWVAINMFLHVSLSFHKMQFRESLTYEGEKVEESKILR